MKKGIKMTLDEVMTELKSMGNEQQKHVFIKHGAKEPFYNVRVGDMKKIVKKIKKDHELSLQLYDTGNTDAMYMAGLIADETKITKEDLQKWVKGAYWYYISDYTVPWVAAESPYGMELALEWIESEEEFICSAGWATLSSMAIIKQDEDIDIEKFSELMDRAEKNVHTAQNRVRYSMNGFIIACGTSIKPLTDKALEIGSRIGKVDVNMGDTACKVPLASQYIDKTIKMGRWGKKKKTARC